VRYGVAPDHPRIKEIVKALRRVLDSSRIRFLGNVAYGTDLKLDDLRRFYDAVIFATGAMADRDLDIPGVDLAGSHGAADFVSWYDGHPDVPREWPLEAESVAVLGAGNVALDVARMLAKPAAEQLTTEIPENVYQGLKANKATTVHVFARRGPAHVKFSPLELRELSHSPSIEVRVEEDGFQIDDAGQSQITANKGTRLVVDTLLKYLEATPTGAPHRIVLHLMHDPVEILGEDGRVVAIRTERTTYNGDGTVRGTGEYVETPVQAVYRAIGYRSSELPDVPFDHHRGVIPNRAGRIFDHAEPDTQGRAEDQGGSGAERSGQETQHEAVGGHLPGLYVTGWVKRGPIGLIGHTKSDAKETIDSLLADLPSLPSAQHPDPDAVLDHLHGLGIDFTTTDGWTRLDAHEQALGAAAGRERVKLVPRHEMVAVAREY
jgi:ferredoxin--NADP+ reductase